MTIRGLGEITPMQRRVLEVGGLMVTPAGVKAASDDERLAVIETRRRVKKLLVDPRRLRLMSLLNQDPGGG